MGEEKQAYYVSVYVPTRSYKVLAYSEQDARNFAVYKFQDQDADPVITSSGPAGVTSYELEAPAGFQNGEDW